MPKPTQRPTTTRPELLIKGSDSEFRQLIHDMLAFAGQINGIRNNLGAAIGLSGTQYTILSTIAHNQDEDGGIGINQIAERLHLSGAFVTIEVNKLVLAKFVSKKTNPDDRRRVLLAVTEEATAILEDLLTLQRPVNDALFEGVTRDEFQQLRALLERLVVTGEQSLNLGKFLTHKRIVASGRSQRKAG